MMFYDDGYDRPVNVGMTIVLVLVYDFGCRAYLVFGSVLYRRAKHTCHSVLDAISLSLHHFQFRFLSTRSLCVSGKTMSGETIEQTHNCMG